MTTPFRKKTTNHNCHLDLTTISHSTEWPCWVCNYRTAACSELCET